MSDTPRTESFIATCGDYEKWPDYRYRLHNFARSLERENDALKAEVERFRKGAEILGWLIDGGIYKLPCQVDERLGFQVDLSPEAIEAAMKETK